MALMQKEILQGSKGFSVAVSPLIGHEVTKEYRTNMMDWMVEVTTSFKTSQRTYFLATQIFDQYLGALNNSNMSLVNKDVHQIGVASMYLASKYEDIYPLHSQIVSDKIAHRAIPASAILEKEKDMLSLMQYQVDFVTHFDFWQTYLDKIKKHINDKNENSIKLLGDMALLLVKMCIQNVEFCKYSPSLVVISSFYASTAFLKQSKKIKEASIFCNEVRKAIFAILRHDSRQDKFRESSFIGKLK